MTDLLRTLRPFARRLEARAPAALRAWHASHRFARWYRRPNTVYLETTSACNLNCVMCAAQRPTAKERKASGFIDPAFFKRIVDEIVSDLPSVKWLYLHKDGEPLLHPRIVELVDYAASRHHDVTLVTNATLLTDELANAILDTPLQKIRFSVDGLSRPTFEKIRIQLPSNEYARLGVPVGFDAVRRNIDRFLELKEQRRKGTLQVGIRTTDFKPTASEVAAYREHWATRVAYVEVAQLMSWSGEVEREDSRAERHVCMAPWGSLVIAWDGTLVPCCSYIPDASGSGALFDLHLGSLVEALNAPRRRGLLLAQLDQTLATNAPYCVNCRDWRSVPLPVAGRQRVLASLGRAVKRP